MELKIFGKSIFAATGGQIFEAGKPTMVLVHGAGMDHTVWSMQARFFAHHGYSVLNFDLPGHGRSEGKPPQSIPEYADWLQEAIRVSGAIKVHLIGHSMGSQIVIALAADKKGSVEKIALLGALAHIKVHPDLLAAAKRGDHSAYETIVGWGVGRRAQLGGHRAPGSWITGTSMRLLETGNPGVLANDLAACNLWEEGLMVASKIKCPTLLLAGSDDRMTPPRDAGELVKIIPNCQLKELQDAGHMMMAEQPEETLNELYAFFGAGDV